MLYNKHNVTDSLRSFAYCKQQSENIVIFSCNEESKSPTVATTLIQNIELYCKFYYQGTKEKEFYFVLLLPPML